MTVSLIGKILDFLLYEIHTTYIAYYRNGAWEKEN